jgi:hypothetical protein
MEKMPNLVLISERYTIAGETPIIPRSNYVGVVTRKAKKGKEGRPEQRLCDHLKPAIYADGMEKGRLVKVCTDRTCKVHFREPSFALKAKLISNGPTTLTNDLRTTMAMFCR